VAARDGARRNLYWRALLEVGGAHRPDARRHGYRSEWDSLLQASGTADRPLPANTAMPVQRNIESYLFFDHDNPSSVATCITAGARKRADRAHGADHAGLGCAEHRLSGAAQLERAPRSELELSRLTEWTMRHAAMVRGAIDATLLRNDGWDFLNLGYYLERADSTARLMDVKYYVLLPRVDFVGSGLDNYQWTTLLRAMGAHRAFHWAYGGEVTAGKIAHFLILNRNARGR
jgi:uncharacterized alpha-E superfamily protein